MKTKLLLLYFMLSIVSGSAGFAQTAPAIEWQKCLGGTLSDDASSIIKTRDGGLAITGSAFSKNGDVSGNRGGSDVWIVKLTSAGALEWQKCLGGTAYDGARSIVETSDGGLAIAGITASKDGDVSGNHGGQDVWVMKLSSEGELQWQKCLGGTNVDYAFSIIETSNSDLAIAGSTESNDGDVSGNRGGSDAWIVRLSSEGMVQWQKCLGGTSADDAFSITETNGDGLAIAGYTESNDGDVSDNKGGIFTDIWVVKLSSEGVLQWEKCLGGTDIDHAYSIIKTGDGGLAIAGSTFSVNGDVTGNRGKGDVWVVKLSSEGAIQWQKCLGGAEYDDAFSIIETRDGGFAIAGFTASKDGDVSGNKGVEDVWVAKLSALGVLQWQKCMGGTKFDMGTSIIETDDGVVIAGFTESNNGDVTGNRGGRDVWVVKLKGGATNISEDVQVEHDRLLQISNSPNPCATTTTISVNLTEAMPVLIDVFDNLGNKVHSVEHVPHSSGAFTFSINCESFTNGTYYYRVLSGSFSQTKMMVISK